MKIKTEKLIGKYNEHTGLLSYKKKKKIYNLVLTLKVWKIHMYVLKGKMYFCVSECVFNHLN